MAGSGGVLLSRRFDRQYVRGQPPRRIPFLTVMSLLDAHDGEMRSYLEMVDALSDISARPQQDRDQLYRRMIFNILISNVDDHLRNHGLLWTSRCGWMLSPAYDLNPTPTHLKARVLSTAISLDDCSCSIALAREQSGYFGLSPGQRDGMIKEVAGAVSGWRQVAAQVGEDRAGIECMSSAFEHQDLEQALRL